MPCFKPLEAWRSRHVLPSGKRGITFHKAQGYPDLPLTIPCGRCIGCKIEKAQDWAIRCQLEASLHDENCFITLTYNRENLPRDLSLNLSHYQNFMKRLRKYYPSQTIRFFHCGEYGDDELRPHYHALLFNLDFHDKIHVENNSHGDPLYESAILNKIWGKGRARIGAVTFQTAQYVARYCTKKITGKLAETHYCRTNPYGDTWQVQPDYATMSRRPGIGTGWFTKWFDDIYPCDHIVIAGRKLPVPKFFDRLLEQQLGIPPEKNVFWEPKNMLHEIKRLRLVAGQKPKIIANRTPDRLNVRETVLRAKLNNNRDGTTK